MAYDHEKEILHEDSDGSESDNEKGKKTKRSIFTDRIAKDLINSHDKVDQRLLKLHKFTTTQKIDRMDYLGVKDLLLKKLASRFLKNLPDVVKKDEKHGDKPILLQNMDNKIGEMGDKLFNEISEKQYVS